MIIDETLTEVGFIVFADVDDEERIGIVKPFSAVGKVSGSVVSNKVGSFVNEVLGDVCSNGVLLSLRLVEGEKKKVDNGLDVEKTSLKDG